MSPIFEALAEEILHIKNLTLSIKEKDLLHFPELIIKSGEIHSLIGESGSGKSLTMLACMGLLSKNLSIGGNLSLFGINSKDRGNREWEKIRGKDVSMVFQEPMSALNPLMTCGMQLLECISVHEKLSKAEAIKKANEALVAAGIEEPERMLESFPHQISGGQRQRVMIAMACVNKPQLVLADEPTTALDTITASRVLQTLVDNCKSNGSALLLVSHDIAKVSEFAEYIHVLRNGKLLSQGKAKDVLGSNRHPYVQELLDAKPKGHAVSSKKDAGHLIVKGLNKSFTKNGQEFKALQNISFSLNEGETLAIIGFSGSGKTTLAKILTGIEKKKLGVITLGGKDLSPKAPTGIQMVFQDPYSSLNTNQSCSECLIEALHVVGKRSKINAKLESSELLNKVGLTGFEMKYPHQMSGGQRQRLCIARALCTQPEVLILDESVAALDPLVKKQILDLLKQLQLESGLIYLFITHEIDVAESIANKYLMITKGEIVYYGKVVAAKDLKDNYFSKLYK